MNTFIKFLASYRLIFIFLLGLTFRLFYSIRKYNQGIVERFADDLHYFEFGKLIAKQGPLVDDVSSLAEPYVGPFLPWVLGLKIKLFDAEWLHIFILNSLYRALFPLFVYYCFKKFFSDRVSFISAIWICLNPMYVQFTPTAGKDLLLCFFNLFLIFNFLKLIKNQNWQNILLFSISVAVSFFVDERFIIYSPFFIILFLVLCKNSIIIKFKIISISFVIICILHLPWLIRNFQVYDRFVLVTERADGIIELFIKNEKKNIIRTSLDKYYLSANEIDEIINGKRTRYNNGQTIRPEKIDFIMQGNLPYKFSYLRNCASNFWKFWKPFDFSTEFVEGGFKINEPWSLIHNLCSLIFYGSLLPFFIYGSFYFRKNTNVFIMSCFVYYSSFIHTFIVLATVNRYRVPIDFLLTLISIMTVEYLIKKRLKGQSILSFLIKN